MPPHRDAAPLIELLLGAFAPENLHWGSDFSPALEFVRFEETLVSRLFEDLPATDRALVTGDGLARKLSMVSHTCA